MPVPPLLLHIQLSNISLVQFQFPIQGHNVIPQPWNTYSSRSPRLTVIITQIVYDLFDVIFRTTATLLQNARKKPTDLYILRVPSIQKSFNLHMYACTVGGALPLRLLSWRYACDDTVNGFYSTVVTQSNDIHP